MSPRAMQAVWRIWMDCCEVRRAIEEEGACRVVVGFLELELIARVKLLRLGALSASIAACRISARLSEAARERVHDSLLQLSTAIMTTGEVTTACY